MPEDSQSQSQVRIGQRWKDRIIGAAAIMTAITTIGVFAKTWFGADLPPWYSKGDGQQLLIEVVEHRLDYWMQIEVQAKEDMELNPNSQTAEIFYERAKVEVDRLGERLLELTGRGSR